VDVIISQLVEDRLSRRIFRGCRCCRAHICRYANRACVPYVVSVSSGDALNWNVFSSSISFAIFEAPKTGTCTIIRRARAY
jgi:hypothetical protein